MDTERCRREVFESEKQRCAKIQTFLSLRYFQTRKSTSMTILLKPHFQKLHLLI